MSGAEIQARTGTVLPIVVGLCTIAAVLALFAAFSVSARLPTTIAAPAEVRLGDGDLVVAHTHGGRLLRLGVRDGQQVQAGDVLLELAANEMEPELDLIERQLATLTARRFRLKAESDGRPWAGGRPPGTGPDGDAVLSREYTRQRALFEARLREYLDSLQELDAAIAKSRAEIAGLDAILAALRAQQELVAGQVVSQSTLRSKGLSLTPKIDALHQERLRLEAEVARVAAARAAALAQIEASSLRRSALTATRHRVALQELDTLQEQAATLAARHAMLLARMSELRMRAPVSGRVSLLRALAPGSLVRAGEPVLRLAPSNSQVRVVALVSASRIDAVHPGQPAWLRFSGTTSGARHPTRWQVASISPRNCCQGDGPGFDGYEIVLEPANDGTDSDPLSPLPPGARAEAFIETGRATPLALLAAPIGSFLADAFGRS